MGCEGSKEAFMRSMAPVLLFPILSACAFDAEPEPESPDLSISDSSTPFLHNGAGGGTALDVQTAAVGIGYGGGPVMLGTPDVYFIWYGNWTNHPAKTILPDFMSHL